MKVARSYNKHQSMMDSSEDDISLLGDNDDCLSNEQIGNKSHPSQFYEGLFYRFPKMI